MRTCMEDKPFKDIMSTPKFDARDCDGNVPRWYNMMGQSFSPIIDKVHLMDNPQTVIEAGKANKVPVLLGTTSMESSPM